MEIKSGMIGLSGGNAFIQKAIKFFTDSDFSHSFTVMDGPYNTVSVLETTSTIVEFIPVVNKLSETDWVLIYEPIATDEEKKLALLKAFNKYSGCWYGYLSYLWFMYRYVCRLFDHEPLHMWYWATSGVTCTELTCHYLSNINADFAYLFKDKDLNAQSPEELLKIIKANPQLFKEVGWYVPKI